MNNVLNAINTSIRSFAKDEDGAQVVEYALIIAVVSIALIVLLQGLTNTGGAFTNFITRVGNCLGSGACGPVAAGG